MSMSGAHVQGLALRQLEQALLAVDDAQLPKRI